MPRSAASVSSRNAGSGAFIIRSANSSGCGSARRRSAQSLKCGTSSPHAPWKSYRAEQSELLALGTVDLRHDLARFAPRGEAVPEVGAGSLTRIVVLAGLDARRWRDRAGMDLRNREDVAVGKAPLPEGGIAADDAIVPHA